MGVHVVAIRLATSDSGEDCLLGLPGTTIFGAPVKLKVLAFAPPAGGAALSALWTFPGILASAFLVAWGAEAAQFLIPQGVALAILAWLQTLPEFAVEAVIAWDAGRDPERARLAIANLTGAIRLLLGLAWPMIYWVFALAGRGAAAERLPALRLERQHAVEVVGLVPPLLYFGVILLKRNFSWVDALVLVALYAVYLAVLLRHPPRGVEQLTEASAVARWAYGRTGWRRSAAIGGLFAAGAALLYATAHAFLESMLAVAGVVGVSQFSLVQWVAPFLSEFPEKLSAFYWARRVTQAPLALMNMVSSNINQWTVLAAMIPLVYGYSSLRHHGVWLDFHFDDAQRLEILLTLLQSALAVLLLANMQFAWLDATLVFVLWLVQFLLPALRSEVAVAYATWMVILVVGFVVRGQAPLAPQYCWETIRGKKDRPEPV
jgi:cation:H+ antiporter